MRKKKTRKTVLDKVIPYQIFAEVQREADSPAYDSVTRLQ